MGAEDIRVADAFPLLRDSRRLVAACAGADRGFFFATRLQSIRLSGGGPTPTGGRSQTRPSSVRHAFVLQLQLRELRRMEGWWRMPPAHFAEGVSYLSRQESGNYRRILAYRQDAARDVVRKTLRRLEDTGVVGRATVVILSDHGARVPWLSGRGVHHIVLTAFLPEQAPNTFENRPVSLIDVAPTLRHLLGFPPRDSDGIALLPTPSEITERALTAATPLAVQAGSAALMDPRAMNLSANVTYRPDGTFALSDQLRAEIAQTIERETRVLKSLEYLLRKNEIQ
jgi:hypothetical protein